jgi:folate-binding protein YgfZ
MASVTAGAATRPRAFVRVAGPEAADYLQRMVSNDVAALDVGASCDALLLTPKARVIAPLRIWRRGDEDFLLLTEPELGDVVHTRLSRMRFAARCEVEREEHRSVLVLGRAHGGIPNPDYGVQAVELLDDEPPADPVAEEELERLRILARVPRWGRELDDRVLPAEAGLEERAISFTKGCYPGQEPVARLHFRGHPNRTLRVIAIDAAEPPEYDAEITHDGKAVGRVTSAVPDPEQGVLALAYVRVSVPDDAELRVGAAAARPLH